MPRYNDAGHEAVNDMLAEMEKKVSATYNRAAKDMQEKLADFLKQYEEENAQKLAELQNGNISKGQYQRWRRQQVMLSNQYRAMEAQLARDATQADRIAASIINGYSPDAYATNINYATYQIEHDLGANTSFTLYNRDTVEMLLRDDPDLLPKASVDAAKDYMWNKTHINNEVTQAILSGEPVTETAKRLQTITGMDERAAMRTARTVMTGAQNAGRLAGYKRAAGMGIEGKLEWVASHDGLTRESHAEVDGEQVEIGHNFSNGLAYPGDPGGPPEEVYNCRCTEVYKLKVLGQVKGESDYEENRYEGKIQGYRDDPAAKKMSYEAWKAKRENNIRGGI